MNAGKSEAGPARPGSKTVAPHDDTDDTGLGDHRRGSDRTCRTIAQYRVVWHEDGYVLRREREHGREIDARYHAERLVGDAATSRVRVEFRLVDADWRPIDRRPSRGGES